MTDQLAAPVYDTDLLQTTMQQEIQAPLPTSHFFGPGVYLRTMTAQENVLVLGRKHKLPSTNLVLSGSMAVIDPATGKSILFGPGSIFSSAAGVQKIGMPVGGTCTWLNIFPNPDNITDLDTMEHLCAEGFETPTTPIVPPFTHSIANTGLVLRNHNGQSTLFATHPIPIGTRFPAFGPDFSTEAAFVPHDNFPNCELTQTPDGTLYLTTIQPIPGSVGGDRGTLLTISNKDLLPCHSEYQQQLL